MKFYKLNQETAQAILAHGSQHSAYLHIADKIREAEVGCMVIQPGGVIGYHQAAGDQLFFVVQGAGWVTGADHVRINIGPGEAAFWQQGEWHESGSESGVTAVVIEGEDIQLTVNER